MELDEFSTENGISDTKSTEQTAEKFELRKNIGLWGGVSVIAGYVVGSGIFVSPVGVLEGTNGSVGLSLVLWVACGILSGLAALCYAELGTCILESGADYAYLNATYGGVVGFIYALAYVFIIAPTGLAAKAIVFGTYVAKPFYEGDCEPPSSVAKCAGAASIVFLTLINYVSMKAATKTQIIFTIAKFLGMAIIIIGGLTRLGMGDPVGLSNFQNAFDSKALAGITASQIGLAFYQGLFSYDGWGNLNKVSEEVKDVGKTLPRCIIIACSSVTVFYVLVNIAYFSVLTPNEMMTSKAVAVTFGDRVFGSFAWIMPLVVCFSIFGSINGSCLAGGRIPFVAARRGHLPQILSMVNVVYITPGPALLIQSGLSLILMIPSDFDTLLNSMSFTTWIFYGLCAAAVLVLRKTRPNIPRPYKVPFVIPIIVVIFSIYLVIAPLIEYPDMAYLYATIFMVCSPILYYPFVYKNVNVPGMDAVTVFLQKLMEVSPTSWTKEEVDNETKDE